MRVFISWSGERSKAIAEALATWLSETHQLLEPWVSSDIDKGKRWGPEVTERLQSSPVGIVCVTPENVSSPWLLFEAGAISNTKDAHVCTLLVDIRPTDVPLPLAQFQATPLEKTEVKKLLLTINSKVEETGSRPLSASTLDSVFEHNWSRLEATMARVATAKLAPTPHRREPAEMLDEVLELLRSLDRRIQSSEAQATTLRLQEIAALLQKEGGTDAAALARLGVTVPTNSASRRLGLAAALASMGVPGTFGAGGGGSGSGA